ncbi:MAG TPA: hypothetical protein VMV69_00685 [Pirellulales bacterium]|nr:hypothetical protein [Pirellulales bacterium]
MNAIQGTIKNGQIVLDDPAKLPEGTRVQVVPVDAARPTLGMREEDWPTTPEGIAALLARMDQAGPGWLSPEDDAAWRAALRAQTEIEKARFFDDAEQLRGIWEGPPEDEKNMNRDPIVDEVRQARQQILDDCGGDLETLLDRLKAAETQDRGRLVSTESVRKQSGRDGARRADG